MLTSKNEANPVSVLEALSTGIPVVSPNVGSICETVIEEKTGLLTQPLSHEHTADAVGRLLGNPTWARELGMRGREHVRASWGVERMVRSYEELIETLYNVHALRQGKPTWKHTGPEALALAPRLPPPLPQPKSSPVATSEELALPPISLDQSQLPAIDVPLACN